MITAGDAEKGGALACGELGHVPAGNGKGEEASLKGERRPRQGGVGEQPVAGGASRYFCGEVSIGGRH